MAKLPRYLFPSDYMADPAAHVFNGKLYIYPSHDWEAGAAFDDDGGHFQMKDYHVLSFNDIENDEATDHGVILDVKDVKWAEKQMWDSDVVEKDGKYGLIGKLDNFYFAYGILAGAGGYTFGINADGSFNENDVGLNNEGTVKGLEIIKDYANNHLPKVLLTDEGWGEIDKLFIEGKAAAVISGPWSLDKYAQSGINYGIAPLPQLSNGNFIRPFYGAKGYVVAKASKNKQLAEKFIRTLNKPVYAMMRYVAIAELPPTKEVMTNPLIVNDDFANAIAHQIEHADLMPSIPRMGKVWGAMAECLSDVISGKKDAKTASNEAVEKIKAD